MAKGISNEENNDIRKTVKNGKRKGRTSNKRILKKLFMSILVILIVVGCIFIIKNRKVNVKEESVNQYNYFLISENNKTGVIDRNGNIIIKPEYDYIQIPNPEKAIFICMFNYDSKIQEYDSKVLNENADEIYTNYSHISALPSNNTSSKTTYQPSILKYKLNDKYGIITLSGKKVTSAIYDSIEILDYKDGVLKISKDGKCGLVKLNGDTIVKANYNDITTDGFYSDDTKYSEAGYIVNVKTDEGYRYGYINANGKEILECKYNSIKRLTEIKDNSSIYLITSENGKSGLNKNAQTVIKNEYESIEYNDTNKILSLEKNGKYGVYDLYGNIILPIQYDDITFGGKIITAHKDSNQLVFDANGNIKKDFNYASIMPTSSDQYYITTDFNGKYGVMDNNNMVLVDNKYSYIEYLFDRYFVYIKDEKAGIIDSSGKSILENKYNVIQKINGTNIMQAINSNYSVSDIYNKDIKDVAQIKNAHIYIKENYVKIISDEEQIYMDFDGNIKNVSDILTDNTIFAKKQNGKWGYVDKNGNVVVDYKYDMATDINEYGFGAIKKDGKWGVVNSKGDVIKEPTYTLSDVEPNFIGEFYKESEDYEIISYSRNVEQ